MEQVARIAQVRELVGAARRSGARVALVPTMGFLHEGHLRLVDEARRRADFVVMSLFVNPTQFGPQEDLSRYPRDPEGDAQKASERGVDLLFSPRVEEMYPEPSSVTVTPGLLATRWEGEVRPGHFVGVLTVVAKLFNIVGPDVAVFGRKDFQQAALVTSMARALDFPIEVVVAPTVRDADGLALSSRNKYLSAEDRRRALALVESLRAASDAFAAGERDRHALERAGRDVLAADVALEVDYFAIVDASTLEPDERPSQRSAAIVAARVGRTRLIDNMVLGSRE